ncbi:MAG: hypothetical protein NTW59_01740 [Candidatus Diapherotrites archaeon]|nr:hypothetical protein [Candidatus Diapherotrites archaeon]
MPARIFEKLRFKPIGHRTLGTEKRRAIANMGIGSARPELERLLERALKGETLPTKALFEIAWFSPDFDVKAESFLRIGQIGEKWRELGVHPNEREAMRHDLIAIAHQMSGVHPRLG